MSVLHRVAAAAGGISIPAVIFAGGFALADAAALGEYCLRRVGTNCVIGAWGRRRRA